MAPADGHAGVCIHDISVSIDSEQVRRLRSRALAIVASIPAPTLLPAPATAPHWRFVGGCTASIAGSPVALTDDHSAVSSPTRRFTSSRSSARGRRQTHRAAGSTVRDPPSPTVDADGLDRDLASGRGPRRNEGRAPPGQRLGAPSKPFVSLPLQLGVYQHAHPGDRRHSESRAHQGCPTGI